jgi:hypothetical protein
MDAFHERLRQDQISAEAEAASPFTLNRQKKTIRGEMSEPAEILLNESPQPSAR